MKLVLIRVMFVFYLYVLIRIILFKFHAMDMTFLFHQLKLGWDNPERIIWRLQQGNLVPFEEISRALYTKSSHGFVNLFGNIAIFVPYGIFQGLIGKNKMSFMEGGIRSLGLSLCLESAQAIFSIGSFDVDDLILNTCGGLLGFLMIRIRTSKHSILQI